MFKTKLTLIASKGLYPRLLFQRPPLYFDPPSENPGSAPVLFRFQHLLPHHSWGGVSYHLSVFSVWWSSSSCGSRTLLRLKVFFNTLWTCIAFHHCLTCVLCGDQTKLHAISHHFCAIAWLRPCGAFLLNPWA